MHLNLCLKILDAKQIRQADLHTIKSEPIASIDLMERASAAFVAVFIDQYETHQRVKVFCGTGNNGGDGLVIARLLREADFEVEVYLIGDPQKGTDDFNANYQRIHQHSTVTWIEDASLFPQLGDGEVVIDAVFGSGISRPVTGRYAELIEYINSCEADVVAVDVASGLGCTQTFVGGSIMQVNRTITFHSPKLSQLLPQNDVYTGQLHVVDIGLDQGFIETLSSDRYLLTRSFVHSLMRKRSKYTHKGNAGRCLLVAGSHGMMGAAVLSAKACMRSGAGLLTMCVPRCGIDIMQVSVPEALVKASEGQDNVEGQIDLSSYTAVGVGPGLGMTESTTESLRSIIASSKRPLVLDADALNILSQNRSWMELLPKDSVLTPHPGEFKRLVGEWQDDYQRLELQRSFAQQYGLVVLVKGAHTTTASPDGKVFFNDTGNPGMATGGSGDVLTGMITSFLGQGYDSLEATLLACYLHGLAGDLYVEQHVEESLIASDLIDYIPAALRFVPENRE